MFSISHMVEPPPMDDQRIRAGASNFLYRLQVEQIHYILRVPSRGFAFLGQALDAALIQTEQVQSESSQQCEIGCCIAQPDCRCVLPEGNVQTPMESILDAPM